MDIIFKGDAAQLVPMKKRYGSDLIEFKEIKGIGFVAKDVPDRLGRAICRRNPLYEIRSEKPVETTVISESSGTEKPGRKSKRKK